jgi:hypothetical protein
LHERDAADAKKLLEMSKTGPTDISFRGYVEEFNRKGMFEGRIICLTVVVSFYWLFSIFPSDETGSRYVPLVGSGLFVLLFVFTFQKSKDN